MADSRMINSGTAPQAWLAELAAQLDQGRPQVLVSVLETRGSTPREVGARMWVGEDFTVDTIGGGHLEWKAIAAARALLDAGQSRVQIQRYPLGPALGQCCGGVVWLIFEYLNRNDANWCSRIAAALEQGESVWREVSVPPLDHDGREVIAVADGDTPVTRSSGGRDASQTFSRSGDLPPLHLCRPDAVPVSPVSWREGVFVDVWKAAQAHVVVCGAGHIGHAIVRVLASLPVRVTWLDKRDDCWPEQVASNVQCVQGDADDVADMPDGAYWLVLTHNHALDLAIVDAVLSQKSVAFLGLIGSSSKRARFISRLSRKHSPERVDQLCCPIGAVQTSSKLPAAIAVSVAAQLIDLMSRNGHF